MPGDVFIFEPPESVDLRQKVMIDANIRGSFPLTDAEAEQIVFKVGSGPKKTENHGRPMINPLTPPGRRIW